jgi:hypothetical protein
MLRQSRYWNEDAGDPALYCGACSDNAGGRNRIHVVPARFIVICERGHLDEFPWNWWVRHDEGCSQQEGLKLEGSSTAGLAGLVLSCPTCGASRSMEGCFGPEAIPPQCSGRRPWLADGDEACEAQPRVAQRGASNIYFPVIESALDIPPWSDDLQKKIDTYWTLLTKAPDAEARMSIVRWMRLAEITGIQEDRLAAMIEDRVALMAAPGRNLRWEEYQQFVQHDKPFGENTEFEIHPAPPPATLASWLESVVRATRLREVRALRGFTRVSPPTTSDDERIAKIWSNRPRWLPAVENRGEGIFLQLRLDRVRQWESIPEVAKRTSELRRNYREAWRQRGRAGEPPRQLTARLLLVHSLAHALMRQLSLTCGYGNASLRERLYVESDPRREMVGLLVFTSSPDADGTLGGLARQGDAANISGIFEEALASLAWCSSDPLCIQGAHARTEPSNGAACHTCLLAPETSCEEFNAFLDRAMLVGTPAEPQLGFFSPLLR